MTDLIFIFLFLPITLILYWVCSPRIRGFLLLFFNLVFYIGFSSRFACLFVISVTVNIVLARILGLPSKGQLSKKMLLTAGIILNIIPLIYFKYSGFAVSIWNGITGSDAGTVDLLAPIGISFYVFKAISLLVEAYRGHTSIGILDAAIYLSFFGQMISGPISRISDINDSVVRGLCLKDESSEILQSVSSGMVRFVMGLSKKILIANVLENIVSEVFSDVANVGNAGALILWLGSICYSLQLFVDFSGYTDMAIGVSEMFGFRCPENFTHPYMTKSFSDFWRRWHISLGAWFRDYVYIPLGGSRGGGARPP